MIAINNFTIKKAAGEENTATFEIGPLPQGYGHTLGAILRRILLSSIPGSAITAVKLDGVEHEYSTLSGLSDDILAVVLSIKNVVVSSSNIEPVTLNISVKASKDGVTEVKASDFEKNSDVTIVNDDYVITKLTEKGASFNAKITVETGVGYVLPEEEKRKEINTIPLDANYSPVKLVKYDVAPTRVGKETELDQLIITVTTNGASEPEEVLTVAAGLLKDMSNHLHENTEALLNGELSVPSPSDVTTEVEKKVEVVEEPTRSLPVKDMNLSTRLTNALLRAGYEDLMQLDAMAEEDIINIRGLGAKSVDELLQVLNDNNIEVK